MISGYAGIVHIQTVCVYSIYDSLMPLTTHQLSHGCPHILHIGFALQLAQAAPVVSHDIFTYALCQRTRLLHTSTSHQAILVT